MSEQMIVPGMGWLPDYPSVFDYTTESKEISSRLRNVGQRESVHQMLMRTGMDEPAKIIVPASKDNRAWCSPIENQGSLGSCTAQAGVGLVEYYERRAFGKHIDASRIFLYKASRNLMRVTGDTGAYLRTTMGALVLFGVPPEEYLPYVIADFDKEPSAFCYSFAQNYQAILYYRLDPPGTDRNALLAKIKLQLTVGFTPMFGFTVYNSIGQAGTSGKIPFPTNGERVLGGHAIVAVGFDDAMKIKNANTGAVETKGAFLIRNSWGTTWGDAGYGWLPYDYVKQGLAVDWWSLVKSEWVDSGQFKP